MVRLGVVGHRLSVRRMSADLGRLLTGVGAVLLDFDGPVCSIFAGYPAPELVDVLRRHGVDVPPDLASEPDPLKGAPSYGRGRQPGRNAGDRGRALRGRAPGRRDCRSNAVWP